MNMKHTLSGLFAPVFAGCRHWARVFAVLLLLAPVFAGADDSNDRAARQDAQGHVHDQASSRPISGTNPERLAHFAADLSNVKVAVVTVRGMVCDFCARGIEKVFHRDESVRKIDIDLDQGWVLIAYDRDKEIDFAEIREKILANGQDATDLQVLEF